MKIFFIKTHIFLLLKREIDLGDNISDIFINVLFYLILTNSVHKNNRKRMKKILFKVSNDGILIEKKIQIYSNYLFLEPHDRVVKVKMNGLTMIGRRRVKF